MKHRMSWAAILGIASIGLTGCPMAINVLDEGPYLGLPTSQRPARGDQLPGTTPTSGGGSGGDSSTGGNGSGSQPGGGSFGESGTNPTQVALAAEAPLRVEALFPKSTQSSVSISNANRGMLAMVGFADLSAAQPTLPTLTVTWPSGSSVQALQAQAPSESSPLTDEATFKQELRRRLGEQPRLGVRGAQNVRGLNDSPPSSVWIITGPEGSENRQIKIYPTEQAIINGKTIRFALAVDTVDENSVFGGTLGTALKNDLNTAIRQNILPSLQSVYGSLPTQAEASTKQIQFRDDVTYFIFSSKLRNGLLGYFNPGDFYPDGNTNQIKALYLSATAAQSARSDTTQLHDLLGTIAHELQHLHYAWSRVKAVGHNVYRQEAVAAADLWIDEGLAMLATANAGYGLEEKINLSARKGPSLNLAAHVSQFLSKSGDYSLVLFKQNGKVASEPSTTTGNPSPAYGMAYLFAQYMVDQLGLEVVGNILSSTKNGLSASSGGAVSGQHDPLGIVNDGLSRHNMKLSTLFANFAAAVALDGTTALDSSAESVRRLYDIQNINLRKSPFPLQAPLKGPASVSTTTAPPRPYGIRILDPGWLETSSTLKFSGNSNVATRLILHR